MYYRPPEKPPKPQHKPRPRWSKTQNKLVWPKRKDVEMPTDWLRKPDEK